MRETDANKRRFRRFVGVVATVLILGAIYTAATIGFGADISWTLVSAIIVVSLAFVGIAVAMKERRELRAGYPKHDERSRAIQMRAGYLAFFISIYFALGMGFALAVTEDYVSFPFSAATWTMLLVAAMGSIFIVVKTYLDRVGVAG